MNSIVGKYDIAFLVLDSLRYDVAEQEYSAGHTQTFANSFQTGGRSVTPQEALHTQHIVLFLLVFSPLQQTRGLAQNAFLPLPLLAVRRLAITPIAFLKTTLYLL